MYVKEESPETADTARIFALLPLLLPSQNRTVRGIIVQPARSDMEDKTKEPSHVEDPVERTVSVEIQKPRISEETYLADDAVVEKQKKTPAEKRLIWKSDLVIVPLSALIYFTAYLVCHSVILSDYPCHWCRARSIVSILATDRRSLLL